jgi:hypothetical protein
VVTGRAEHDMDPGAISVRRIDEDASWEQQAFLPASRYILGMRVDATNYQDATEQIIGWARRSESRYVCVAAVNNVMQAYDDEGFLGWEPPIALAAGLRETYGWIESQLRESDRIPASLAGAAAEG